jgi:SpoVK/Ycf46/Vps4 family AAA+-type ATPase
MHFGSLPTDARKGHSLFHIKQPDCYFKDLVFEQDVHTILERLIEEFRSWEILEANGLQPTRRILFCGPSGCGKTATAEAIACERSLCL